MKCNESTSVELGSLCGWAFLHSKLFMQIDEVRPIYHIFQLSTLIRHSDVEMFE